MPTLTRRGRSSAAAALTQIELNGTPDIAAYATRGRDELRGIAMEYDLTAAHLERRLARALGGGAAARWQARRAMRRLRKAASAADTAAALTYGWWKDYLSAFAAEIHPERQHEAWKWPEDGRQR